MPSRRKTRFPLDEKSQSAQCVAAKKVRSAQSAATRKFLRVGFKSSLQSNLEFNSTCQKGLPKKIKNRAELRLKLEASRPKAQPYACVDL